MRFVVIAITTVLLHGPLLAMDYRIIYSEVIDSSSSAGHIDPILGESGLPSGYIICTPSTSSISIVGYQAYAGTINLPHPPVKAIHYLSGDTLFVYALLVPTSYSTSPVILMRFTITSQVVDTEQANCDIAWVIDGELEYLATDLTFLQGSLGQPAAVSVSIFVHYIGYMVTIGPENAKRTTTSVYSLDLSSRTLFATVNDLAVGHFTSDSSWQYAGFDNDWYKLVDLDQEWTGWGLSQERTIVDMEIFSAGQRVRRNFLGITGFAIFADDIIDSLPHDEIIHYGMRRGSQSDSSKVQYVGCYGYMDSALIEARYSVVNRVGNIPLNFFYQYKPERLILGLPSIYSSYGDRLYTFDYFRGRLADSVHLGRSVCNPVVYENGDSRSLNMFCRKGDTVFVYRFDAITDVEDETPSGLPSGYTLRQNYPNPFNATTEIVFTLPRAEEIAVKVYNLLGQEVATLAEGRFGAGEHRVSWDGRDTGGAECASGVYLYRLDAGESSQSRKMVLLR